jgi:ornithine carbamoyltransferase
MKSKHLISIRDLSVGDLKEVYQLAAQMKRSPETHRDSLRGRTLGMFYHPSTPRLGLAFEVGIHQLGGLAIDLSASGLALEGGESAADTACLLSRYVDGLIIRGYGHGVVVELARHATVPVVNGLSDLLNPCQALADYFTLLEKKQNLKGRRLAYVGRGGSMCHSLLYGANKVGMNIAVASPEGSEPKAIIVKSANREASQSGIELTITRGPGLAVDGADAVYTDGWLSPGEGAGGSEAERAALLPYQVTAEMMARAKPDAVFMHGLPAHRDEEVSAEVLDGPQSIVFDQAENNLHVQKAVLSLLIGGSSA